MRRVIMSWREAMGSKPSIQVISGSATSLDPETWRDAGGQISVSSTVLHDSVRLGSLLRSGRRKWPRVPLESLAVLREGSSEYGSAEFLPRTEVEIQSKTEPTLVLRGAPTPGKNDRSKEPAKRWPERIERGEAIEIAYPMRIGMLRGREGASSSQLRSILDWITGGSSATIDTASASSEAQHLIPVVSETYVSDLDRSLSTALSSLDREVVEHVLILATHRDDVAFLAKRVRRFSPNSAISLLAPELFYASGTPNRFLRGAWALSTYSVNPLAQGLTRNSGATSRLAFTSEASQGVFNATSILVGRWDNLVEFEEVKHNESPRGPWLSVVGSGGIWPVWKLPLPLEEIREYGYLASAPPDRRPVNVHRGRSDHDGRRRLRVLGGLFQSVMIGLVAVAAGAALLITFRSMGPAGRTAWTNFRWTGRPWVASSIIAAGILGLIAFEPAVACGRAEDLQAARQVSSWILVFGLVLSVLAVSTMLFRVASGIIRYSWLARRGKFRQGTVRTCVVTRTDVGVGLVSIALLIPLQRWLDSIVGGTPEEIFFAALRISTLSSGVSPFLPIALSLLALVLLVAAANDRWERTRQMLAARAKDDSRECFPWRFREAAFFARDCRSRTLRLASTHPMLALPAVIAVAVWFSWYHWRWIGSIEGPGFDLAVRLVLVLGMIGVALTSFRVMAIWSALRSLTRVMAWQRSGSFWLSLSTRLAGRADMGIFARPSFTVLCAARDALEEILYDSETLSQDRTVLARRARVIRSTLSAAQIRRSEDDPRWRSDLRTAERELVRALVELERGARLQRGAERKLGIGARIDDLGGFLGVYLLQHAVVLIRSQMTFASISMMVLIAASSAYPFPSSSMMLTLNLLISIGFGIGFSWVLVTMERDAVLSELSGTPPGKLTLEKSFLGRIVVNVLLPLATLLGLVGTEAVPTVTNWMSVFIGS